MSEFCPHDNDHQTVVCGECYESRIRTLEGALRFYADPDSWSGFHKNDPQNSAYHDEGARARAALEADRPATTVVTLSQIEAAFPFGVWRLKSGPPWHKAFVAAQTPSFIRLSPEQIAERLVEPCGVCDGLGYILVTDFPPKRETNATPPCPTCHGTGKAEWQLYEFVMQQIGGDDG